MKRLRIWLPVIVILLLTFGVHAQNEQQLVEHNGQQLFLNGINLAWISFAHDLQNFDEVRFVAALDEIAAAHGNTLRWWLHTNGSASPVYGEDGRVTGLGEHDIENLQRAAALAYERGILLQPTLWSHDMMNDVQGVPTDANKRMIEDPEYTQAYIDNALIPLVEAFKGNPDIVAWEIFNEPEGVTDQFGWTDQRTDMAHIQQFVNLLAGAIHRADPAVQVTNGSWNMQVLTDIEGMTNYYRDDRLIAAGGDPDGTLDFYEVHYYPEYFDETTSPFHNPYAHWELDKPLVIGEFPAKAIANLGNGFLPRRQLRNSMESYEYLYDNGYAGALAWTFYASDFGKMLDATPGILRINNLAPEHVQLDIGDVDHLPTVQRAIENLVVRNDVSEVADYVDLQTIFSDAEDGTLLGYSVTENSRPDLVDLTIDDQGMLSLAFTTGTTGTAVLQITATDSVGHFSRAPFVVQMIDPNRGNVALGKDVFASTVENESYLAQFAVDGLETTRWSTEYVDGQTLTVDLGRVFSLSQVILRWEAAFGANYDIQVWDGSVWQTVYSEVAGDGGIDDIALPEPVDARYMRMNGVHRGTEWGFSLWEFEVYGVLNENGDAALETEPPDLASMVTPEATAAVADQMLLHSFETDEEGWKLATDWRSGTGIGISDELASDGAQSLAVQASFTGAGWQEAGAAYDPEGGTDWTDASQLKLDVYVPEGANNFVSQVFIKTGGDWTWANTPDTPLTPDEWTTITADLSVMGDLSAVREYGVKFGMSDTQFNGDILIDNVRLVNAQTTAAALPNRAAERPEVEPEVAAINSVTASSESVGLYQRLELVADIDAVFNNPYDPNDIRVDGRFESPSGKIVIVPGFYYQDFAYAGGSLTASDNWSWRVRFTPTEVGEWQYRVLATTLKGTKRSETGTFSATESDSPGFVRVDPRNSHYFVFDDGTPYVPVGENIGWSTGDPIADYGTWLDSLAAAGGNFARVWMAPWGFSIEWLDTGLGNYDLRQSRAYQLDQVMDLMAQHNVYVMLSLLNHGQFSVTTDAAWDQNPFNAVNGGPLDTPADFATNPEAIRLWNQRLRYIAARWGYSPNIMTWEWWNEVNWTALVNSDLLAPWAARSAAYLRSLDPNHHLITTSGSPVEDQTVWSLDSLDFTQVHLYNMTDLPLTFNQVIPEWLQGYPDKPFLVGEFGSPLDIDVQGELVHQGMWSAIMNGAAGTGMTWWWDTYIHPLDLYDHFAGIAAFMRGEDMAARQWQPASAEFAERVKARVYGLQADDYALLWVVNRDYSDQYLQTAYTRAVRAAIRAGREEHLLSGFEDDTDGWSLVADWTAGEGITPSAEQASEGDQSLALVVTFTGDSWQEAGITRVGDTDWSGAERLSLDVYVPEGAEDFIAQVYTKSGNDWTWTQSLDLPLTAGQWNTLTIPVADLGDASSIHEFGLKIGSSTGQTDGAFYVDNVRLIGAPVQPDLIVEFPTVEGAALNLTGLQSGAYTVEVWDTIGGEIIVSSPVETADGAVTITLPDFSTDLAIKVKPE